MKKNTFDAFPHAFWKLSAFKTSHKAQKSCFNVFSLITKSIVLWTVGNLPLHQNAFWGGGAQ